jgi:hypothetical protein
MHIIWAFRVCRSRFDSGFYMGLGKPQERKTQLNYECTKSSFRRLSSRGKGTLSFGECTTGHSHLSVSTIVREIQAGIGPYTV